MPTLKTKKISIVILTWNGIEYTRKCLQTLRENTPLDSVEVIVVDNGSTDGTPEYLKTQEWIRPVFNKKNIGFVRANNMAIDRIAPENDIILINNDIEIHDNCWIEKFRRTAYGDEKIGIVGSRIRRPDGTLQHAGTYMSELSFRGVQIGSREKDINQYNIDRDVEGVVFACVYIKSNVIQKIGSLNTDYFSYYEDTDYCLEAKKAGFRVAVCGSLTVLHHEHATTKINQVDHDDFFLRSRKIFKKKWIDYLSRRHDQHVCWHSTFDRPYGYGMISRDLAVSLENHRVGVSYQYLYGPGTVYPVEERVNRDDDLIHIIRKRKPYTNAPHVIFGQADAFGYIKNGYRIGYTMLETTGIPEKWVKQANNMDEVWTPSPFNAWTFKNSGVKKPIYVMPLGVDIHHFNPHITGYPIKDTYTFLSIFEWGERKAPEILLTAFNQVFTKTEPVVLICKYVNYDPSVNVDAQVAAMNLDPDGGQVIYSINQHVPYYQLAQLYRSSDCFVLTTRGEGWGMPILEAMACGLPVIAPFWSAQQFFMTDANSYPLQVEKLIDAEAKCPYYKKFKWAHPDIAHLKRLLRHVYENQDEAGRKGAQAARDAKEKWSLDLCTHRMRRRIETIGKDRLSGKKPPFDIITPKPGPEPVIGLDISRSIGEQVTGVGRAALSLLKGLQNLSKDDNPFRFLLLPGLGSFVHPEYMKRFFYDKIDDDRFTLYRGPLPAFSDPDHYVPGLDLVHSTAYMKPDTNGIPLVITVHDLTFATHPQFHTHENIHFCETNIQKAMRLNCHFFADSKNTKDDMVKIYGIDPNRISVIYIPVDCDTFHPIPTDEQFILKQKYKLPDRFFLFVGSFEPRKNLKSLIEAMEIFRGPEPLVIIGASGWKNSDLYNLFNKTKEKVQVMGYIPLDELPIFYSAACATVYPSLYEGFGLPVLESMACATPVITSNNSSIPEVAGNACLMLDEPTDAMAIAHAMAMLSEDENLRKRLSREGLAQAKKFLPELCAHSAIREYAKIMGVDLRS